jgi:hypothetical protein
MPLFGDNAAVMNKIINQITGPEMWGYCYNHIRAGKRMRKKIQGEATVLILKGGGEK